MTGIPVNALAEHAFVAHEHAEVARGLDDIHEIARFRGSVSSPDVAGALREVVRWLDDVLEPHAAWEDGWLYPEIDRRAGTPWATRLMTFEHGQIRELGERLRRELLLLREEHGTDLAMDVRGILIGLETLVRAHVERETRFLLPLLDERPRSGSAGSPVPDVVPA